jgi:hypothetical protein
MSRAALEASAGLPGKVVLPGDREYELLRSTYTTVNSPSCIARAHSVHDVRAALKVAANHGVALTVRSGGHSLAGLSSNDGGLVLDLSAMNAVTVLDRERRLVRVQPGARWGAVAEALRPHGLAISSGNYGNVGVGGLATAGGIGWMVRAHGLTIDHLREVKVVLASGELLSASESINPDLFWAIRGAGSRIGVAVEFTFEASATERISIARFETTLRADLHPLVAWDELVRAAPRELTLELQMRGTSGMVTAVWASDDTQAARRALAPFTNLGPTPSSPRFRSMPYASLVPRAHEHPNVGQQLAITHNGLVDDVTPDVEAAVLEALASGLFMQFRSLGGAVGDIHSDATAYPHRHQSQLIVGTVFHPSEELHLDEQWSRLAPAFTGAYANFESRPTALTNRLAYPRPTALRLQDVKRRYDPDGMFPSVDPDV